MTKIHICIAVLLLSLLPFAAQAGEKTPSLLQLPPGAKSVSMIAQDIHAGRKAELRLPAPYALEFILSRDSPNGTKIFAMYGDKGENLGVNLEGMAGINEYGEMEEGFAIQLAACDLNGDGIPEVLVATGNMVAELTVAVFTYNPKAKEERFRRVGVAEGQREARIEKDGSITMPYGSQGLFKEYRLTAKGELTEKQ